MRKYNLSLDATVRSTISVGRYDQRIAELETAGDLEANNAGGGAQATVQGSLSIISGPNKTVVCGAGQLYNDFLESKKISGYAGELEEFSHFGDPDYNSSKLQIVRFDQAFMRLPFDVRRRNYNFLITSYMLYKICISIFKF